MRPRQFRLLVASSSAPGDAAVETLFGRCDDLCVEVLPAGLGRPGLGGAGLGPVVDGLDAGGGDGGVLTWVAFDRMAPSLIDAVVSGVRDLDSAGLPVAAAIADDPLVTAETIAERVDRPVAAVRSWGLPGVVREHPRRPVYDWPEVLEWLTGRVPVLEGASGEAATFEAVTLTLRVRALGPRLERMTPLRSLLL
ncbi:hypothetical protein [Dactylosporangium sp. CA-139066]|uniref:hypothetical protein n=1 Tax=Dactylosporangium sp. CA-139066 TaxID=3239930 RepID=UPI003D8EAB17